MVEKGSITVDGISLTVVDVLDDGFTVAVIPHTAAVTTLGHKGVGDPVNLEVDVMAKYAERLLRPSSSRLTVPPPPHLPRRPAGSPAMNVKHETREGFAAIPDAIAAIARGEIVVVVDDEDRENEGDLIMAAESATPEKIAFFVRHTSGVICAPLTGERLDELDIPLMVRDNTEAQRTAFTYSVDFRHGTSTGISAGDRAATIQSLIDPATRPGDLARPGSHLPAALLRRRRAQAGRPHRGGGRPGPHGRPVSGRRAVRDRQRRRHHGPRARAARRSAPPTTC